VGARTVIVLTGSLIVAEVSFRVLESPLRHGGLAAWPRRWLPVTAYVVVAFLAIGMTVPGAKTPVSASDVVNDAAPVVQGTSAPMGSDGRLVRPPDRDFRLFVTGDSVGDSIVAPFTDQRERLGVEVFSRAAPSCSYDRVRTQQSGDATNLEPASCVDIVNGWRSDVSAFRPDAVLFMYGSWSSWFFDGAYRSQCDAVMQAHVVSLYEQAVADLGSTGAPVYFVLPSYWRLRDATSADAAYDCTRDLMRRFAATHPTNVRAIDPGDLVCRGTNCSSSVDGSPVRPDGLHFSGPGGRKVATYIAAAMFAPPAAGWPEFPPVEFS
jgi:hypothetical protein